MDTSSSSIPSISPQELALRIGTPDAPLVLDVRRQPRFDESPRMLATALRCAPEDVAALAAAGPPRSVVVYCVHGHEVSQGAAATLRGAGWDAYFLEGGIESARDTPLGAA